MLSGVLLILPMSQYFAHTFFIGRMNVFVVLLFINKSSILRGWSKEDRNIKIKKLN